MLIIPRRTLSHRKARNQPLNRTESEPAIRGHRRLVRLWRLTRRLHADLRGQGGELADGRWHTRGRPVVYCATTAARTVAQIRSAMLGRVWRMR